MIFSRTGWAIWDELWCSITVCPKILATSCLSSPHHLIGRRRCVTHLDGKLVDWMVGGRRSTTKMRLTARQSMRLGPVCCGFTAREEAGHKTTTKRSHPAACASLPRPLPQPTKPQQSRAALLPAPALPQPIKPQQSRAILLPAPVCLLFCHSPQNHNKAGPLCCLRQPCHSP